jgi:hypothetical protein
VYSKDKRRQSIARVRACTAGMHRSLPLASSARMNCHCRCSHSPAAHITITQSFLVTCAHSAQPAVAEQKTCSTGTTLSPSTVMVRNARTRLCRSCILRLKRSSEHPHATAQVTCNGTRAQGYGCHCALRKRAKVLTGWADSSLSLYP